MSIPGVPMITSRGGGMSQTVRNQCLVRIPPLHLQALAVRKTPSGGAKAFTAALFSSSFTAHAALLFAMMTEPESKRARTATRTVNVLMLGTGEYTTGFTGKGASDSDKSTGVVALVMLDLKRLGKVGRIGMCGVNGKKLPAIREHMQRVLGDVYKGIDPSCIETWVTAAPRALLTRSAHSRGGWPARALAAGGRRGRRGGVPDGGQGLRPGRCGGHLHA